MRTMLMVTKEKASFLMTSFEMVKQDIGGGDRSLAYWVRSIGRHENINRYLKKEVGSNYIA